MTVVVMGHECFEWHFQDSARVYVCMYVFLYKFILHAPLQECNTTCNGVLLNNKQNIH